MYAPIANNDVDTINALLKFYKKIYTYIGIIILVVGSLVIPFLPFLVKGEYPVEINIVIVYMIFLVNTVLSYFTYGYLSSIITAFQRDDLLSKINIFITTGMYIVQIIILLTVNNYYIYILVMPVFTIITNIGTAIIAKKMFPQYIPKGKLEECYKNQIKEKVSGLFIFKLCYVTRNAFDSIFISMFLGLASTAIYNNYYYIMNAVVGITSVFTTAILSGAGNSVEMETVEKNYNDMNKMNFIYMWITGWFTTCLLCLYQPFMNIWVGKSMMYPFSCVVLICLYFYILKMGDIRYVYEQAKGLWWEYRYRSILEAIANIVLNFVLGKFFGVYGIIFATIITIFVINYFWGAKIIFKEYFVNQKISEYFLQNIIYFIVMVVTSFITLYCCKFVPYSFVGLGIRGIICLIVPNFLRWIILKHNKRYKEAMPWFLNKLNIKK